MTILEAGHFEPVDEGEVAVVVGVHPALVMHRVLLGALHEVAEPTRGLHVRVLEVAVYAGDQVEEDVDDAGAEGLAGLPDRGEQRGYAGADVRPKISAMPAGSVMSPWVAITMTTPVVAELDCTRAVKSAPAAIPTAGDSSRVIQSRKGA